MAAAAASGDRPAYARSVTRTQPLPSARPHEQGVDAAGLLSFLDAAELGGHELHSLVVARHAHVVAEGWWAPYTPERVHLMYSLSKSFTATAVGLLVDEGRLDLDARVFDLVPTGGLPVPPRYRSLTVRHCLSMATGHLVEAFDATMQRALREPAAEGVDPVVRAILARPPYRDPGTVFAYNQVATYLVAAVVRSVTGGPLLDWLRHRLLDPLGIEEALWHRTALGHELGFSGLHVDTGAVLALAQLYLAAGRLGDRQVLSAEWVRAAVTPSGLPNHDKGAQPDWCRGYGFSFWTSRHGYRGDGAYAQFALVLPQQEAVVAMTAEDDDMQGVLDLVWEHVVPVLGSGGDGSADDVLAERLAGAAIPALGSAGSTGGPQARRWLPDDEEDLGPGLAAVTVTSAEPDQTWELELHARDGGVHRVLVGDGHWAESALFRDQWVLPVLASGGWAADGGFEADLRLIETPHTIRVRATPAGRARVSWRRPPLTATDPFLSAVREKAAKP
jgi:CubicO group peptidase (beta-lactamase class C family)